MRAYLTLFVVLFVALAGVQEAQSTKPQSQKPHQAKKTAPKEQAQPVNIPQASETLGAIKDAKDQIIQAIRDGQKQQYDARSDWLYRAYLGATVIGVIGGLIGLRFLIRQTKLTEIAANAATASAEAANVNADAIMKAERAWIIAAPTDNAPVVGFVPQSGNNHEAHIVGANQQNAFSCSFKSTGSTPARLIEVAICYRKANSLEDIPKEPNYGHRTSLNDLPLVKDDSIGFVTYLEPDIVLSKADYDAVWQQKAFLYAYGIIVYRDVYDRIHETRFGYIYHFPQGGDPRANGFRRESLPSSYNGAT